MKKQLTEFKKGDRVNYFSFGEKPDPGTVTSVNSKFVFVLFDKYTAQHCTSQACAPNDLEKTL